MVVGKLVSARSRRLLLVAASAGYTCSWVVRLTRSSWVVRQRRVWRVPATIRYWSPTPTTSRVPAGVAASVSGVPFPHLQSRPPKASEMSPVDQQPSVTSLVDVTRWKYYHESVRRQSARWQWTLIAAAIHHFATDTRSVKRCSIIYNRLYCFARQSWW